MKMLKRHLRSTYGMTPEEYRAKWNLPADYPMVAPTYAEKRSEFAKAIGLGRSRTEPEPEAPPAKTAASELFSADPGVRLSGAGERPSSRHAWGHRQVGGGVGCLRAVGRLWGQHDELDPALYAGHRFPPELISYAVWLYFRFPLSLRMVEEMLAFRGIAVRHEAIRQWGLGPQGQRREAVISAGSSPTPSVGGCRGPATSGTWMKSFSRSPARSIICGTLWISTASCLMVWFTEPPRQEGRQAAVAQAAEATMPGSPRDDHR